MGTLLTWAGQSSDLYAPQTTHNSLENEAPQISLRGHLVLNKIGGPTCITLSALGGTGLQGKQKALLDKKPNLAAGTHWCGSCTHSEVFPDTSKPFPRQGP